VQADDATGRRRPGRVREFARQPGEILAGAGALENALGLRACAGDLRLGGVLRDRDQDVRQVDLHGRRVAAALQLNDVLVDFEVAHANARLELALAQPREQQLVAQLLPELRHRNAVGRQPAAQLGDVDAILPRQVLFGHVDRGLLRLDALLARELDLRLLDDEPLEHLPRELGARRQGLALLRQLLLEARHAHAHFVVGDRLRIDDGDDEVRRSRRAVRNPGRRPGGAGLGRAQALRRGGRRQRQGLRRAGQPEGIRALCHGAHYS